jgi:hypothetical protein
MGFSECGPDRKAGFREADLVPNAHYHCLAELYVETSDMICRLVAMKSLIRELDVVESN